MADPTSTHIYDNIFPKISTSLNSPANVRKIQEFFSNVKGNSTNFEALSMSVPYKSLFIHHKDEQKYFETIGMSGQEILRVINTSPHIPKDSWFTVKNPMYMSLLLVAIYFKNKKNEQMFKAVMQLWSIYMYKNVKSKYFNPRKTGENALHCMNYTINRLSYKNDLKKYKNIEETINKKTEMFIKNWFEERKKDVTGKVTDEILCNMINDNHRRYDTLFKNFYSEFKKDLDTGNYLNVDQDIDTEDEYIESDNVSFMVEKNTQKVMNKFILTTYPNGKIMEQVCSREPGCSINNLRNMLNYIYSDNEKEFEKIVRVVIQIYLFEYKKKVDDLKTFDFELTMKSHYKKQSIDDKNLNELKKSIDNIVDKSGLTKKITRAATLNDCKRGLFLYIIIYIRYSLIN
jgi:hypothetical protein